MKRQTKIIIPILLIILLGATTLLTACGGPKEIYMCSDGKVAGPNPLPSGSNVLYVCPTGNKVSSPTKCSYPLKVSITEKDAELKATNFVNGYVSANSWYSKFVNAYLDEGMWYAQIVISKRGEESYQTTVSVNATTGIVDCVDNCDYIVN